LVENDWEEAFNGLLVVNLHKLNFELVSLLFPTLVHNFDFDALEVDAQHFLLFVSQ